MKLEACLESTLPHFSSTLARLRATGDIELEAVDAICGALVRDLEVARDNGEDCPGDSNDHENALQDDDTFDVEILSDVCDSEDAESDFDPDSFLQTPTAVSASTTPPTAAHIVFATVELLELILDRLPDKAILVNQRVAKQWKDVVQGSVLLRRRVFLEDISIAEQAKNGFALKRVAPSGPKQYELAAKSNPADNRQKLGVRAVLNPLLHRIPKSNWSSPDWYFENQLSYLEARVNHGDIAMIEDDVVKHWRRSKQMVSTYGNMFLTQPSSSWVYYTAGRVMRGVVRRQGGVRLQDVLEDLEQRCKYSSVRPFHKHRLPDVYKIVLRFPGACDGPEAALLFSLKD